MKTILNLTQHKASPEQIEAHVQDLDDDNAFLLRGFLTFDSLPTQVEMIHRANKIGDLLTNVEFFGKQDDLQAMIGGAPFFMPVLAEMLVKRFGITPVYAFSKRVAVDEPDGTKTSVFKHIGFVEHPF